MKDTVYQHFRPKEYPLIDRVYGWMEGVEASYRPYLTPFLNPRDQYIIESIVGHRDTMTLHSWGGYPASERKRFVFAPAYYEVQEEDYAIQAFEIDYAQDFNRLSHGHILGSLLNMGLDRNRFGDIIQGQGRWQFFSDQLIAEYVHQSFWRVGRHSVISRPISFSDLVQPEIMSREKDIVLSSLRLDNVVSQSFNLSRSAAKQLVLADKVKLNWADTKDPAAEVSEEDTLSVRTYGRVRLKEILRKTKKEKHLVRVAILNRNQ